MFVFAGHREPAVPWGVFALPQRCCRSEKDVPSVERLLLLLQRVSYDVSSYVALKGLNYGCIFSYVGLEQGKAQLRRSA